MDNLPKNHPLRICRQASGDILLTTLEMREKQSGSSQPSAAPMTFTLDCVESSIWQARCIFSRMQAK